MPVAIIDPHQHFWDLSLRKHPWLCNDPPIPFRYGDYSAIRRNYLPDDYRRDSAGFNVVKTVHMEAEWDPEDPLGETRWLMALRRQTGYPNAIIGQIRFQSSDVEAVLAEQASCPLMRSVRQKPAAAQTPDEVDPGAPGAMGDPLFRAGYRHLARHGLHYDLQTPWWHLPEAADLARDFPETTIILNHTGLPSDRSPGGLKSWQAAMSGFAARPNTAVKISGICVPGRAWTAGLNREVVLETLRLFGTDRCMFASNFPVDRLGASFSEIFSGFAEIVAGVSDADRAALFHDNAAKFYRPD